MFLARKRVLNRPVNPKASITAHMPPTPTPTFKEKVYNWYLKNDI